MIFFDIKCRLEGFLRPENIAFLDRKYWLYYQHRKKVRKKKMCLVLRRHSKGFKGWWVIFSCHTSIFLSSRKTLLTGFPPPPLNVDLELRSQRVNERESCFRECERFQVSKECDHCLARHTWQHHSWQVNHESVECKNINTENSMTMRPYFWFLQCRV